MTNGAATARHVVLVAVAAACSGVPGSPLLLDAPRIVRIATSMPSYAPGEVVNMTFENISGAEVLLNTCNGSLDIRASDRWTAISAAVGDGGGHDDLQALAPGGSVGGSLTLRATLQPGVYRFRFTGIFDSSMVLLPESERVSNLFTIP